MPSSFLCMQLPRRSLQNQMAATPMASLEREGPWRHRRDAGRQSEPLHLDLVVLGRNNPSPYTVNGRPLYVHLNGLAIVLLK
jgi:hypothetical protein